jgi:hypothetical protein
MSRESYEDAWFSLDEREQEEAVNEHIIMPEVVLKNPEPPRPEFVSFPRLRFVFIELIYHILLDDLLFFC